MLTIGIVNASNPTTLSEKIYESIKYPEFAFQNKIEGVVLVSFQINNDGIINVDLANASNEDLKNYVVTKLKNMVLPVSQRENSRYNMKFVFKLL